MVALRTTIERLMKRAGKTTQFERIRCIRNSLPQSMKDKTEIVETEDKLWKKINIIHVTHEVDKLDKGMNECSNCGKAGHLADVCRKTLDSKSPAYKPRTITKRNGESYSRCGRDGHLIGECFSPRHQDSSTRKDPSRAPKPDFFNTKTGGGNKSEALVTRQSNSSPSATTTVTQLKLCYRC